MIAELSKLSRNVVSSPLPLQSYHWHRPNSLHVCHALRFQKRKSRKFDFVCARILAGWNALSSVKERGFHGALRSTRWLKTAAPRPDFRAFGDEPGHRLQPPPPGLRLRRAKGEADPPPRACVHSPEYRSAENSSSESGACLASTESSFT
jgi:hypothetical protein